MKISTLIIITLATSASTALLTKPDVNTFRSALTFHLRTKDDDAAVNDNLINNTLRLIHDGVDQMAATVVAESARVSFYDAIFCLFVKVELIGNETLYFIGIYQQWFPIPYMHNIMKNMF